MSGLFKIQQQHRLPNRLTMLLLCAALLFVQCLGQVHRALHWPNHGSGSSLTVARADSSDMSFGTVARGDSPGLVCVAVLPVHADQGFQGLFKDHQDLPKCQLFDGVITASALTPALTSALIPAQGLILSTFYNVLVAERLSRHFQARAPPYA